VWASLVAGLVIGAVEVVLAVSFAALIFGGLLVDHLADGIGLYLVAGALTLGLFAWLTGPRGVVASLQGAAAAVISVLATTTALDTFGGPDRAFLTVVVAIMIVTLLSGIAFLLLGTFRLGNLVRFVPYPVVGGFLAGMGWLLVKGGLGVAASIIPSIRTLTPGDSLKYWVPAFAFGVVLLLAARIVKHPLVLPVVIGLGLVAFSIWTLGTGLSIEEARSARWLLGDFASAPLWQPWALRAIPEADWVAVAGQIAVIATAIFVTVISLLFNVSGTELLLRTDLDSNLELRHAGAVDVVLGALGGIPGYHAVSLTSLGQQMSAPARSAGSIAAAVPLAAAVFGAALVGMLPRMIVGGVLVFVGLSFIVEWVVDARRTLPKGEWIVVLVILLTVIARGLLPGVVVGMVAALVLFAVNYGRIELLHEVEFGETYRSNVDRPPDERAALVAMRDRVQILRLDGFVFFGSANVLLERIRRRVERGGLRFLLVDVRRVTGMDASAVVSFRKIVQLAEAGGIELILAGGSDRVRRQLERGGVAAADGVLAFVPDLDRGLERCEDGLLQGAALPEPSPDGALAGMPALLERYVERVSMPEGAVLIRQDEPPESLFVLASGRLRVEMVTPEGRRMRLRTVRAGVVVGEVAMYAGTPRTADVIADSPIEVLRLSRASIERLEAEEPELAASLHRWLAGTLAGRLRDALRVFDALLD
jgi:SulP family sulfate permease